MGFGGPFLLLLMVVGSAIVITVMRGNQSGTPLSVLRILGSVYYGMAAFCVIALLGLR